jgi:hypothetical protein
MRSVAASRVMLVCRPRLVIVLTGLARLERRYRRWIDGSANGIDADRVTRDGIHRGFETLGRLRSSVLRLGCLLRRRGRRLEPKREGQRDDQRAEILHDFFLRTLLFLQRYKLVLRGTTLKMFHRRDERG